MGDIRRKGETEFYEIELGNESLKAIGHLSNSIRMLAKSISDKPMPQATTIIQQTSSTNQKKTEEEFRSDLKQGEDEIPPFSFSNAKIEGFGEDAETTPTL